MARRMERVGRGGRVDDARSRRGMGQRFAVPACLGLAGAAGMLAGHGWSLSVVACAAGALALAGAVAGWALAQLPGAWVGGASRRAPTADGNGGDLGSLEADALLFAAGASPQFWRKVILVWSRQITSAKAQMEAAVQELTTRFLGIVEKLDQALAASSPASMGRQSPGQAAAGSGAPGPDGGAGLGAVFSRSEAELGNVTASLKASTTSQAAMLTKVQELSSWTQELDKMAEDVQRISGQTRLLSLNATIEATRAGAFGRGFAVVAAEVRELSTLSSATGERIAEKVAAISAAIVGACQSAELAVRREGSSAAASEATIDTVLTSFKEVTDGLTESAGALRSSSAGIKAEVAEAIVLLQFQDRVSQIMTHLHDNIDRCLAHLEASPTSSSDDPAGLIADHARDADRLLSELQASYTTDEERAQHLGQSSTSSKPSRDVTFF